MIDKTRQAWPLTDFQLQVWAGQVLRPASPMYSMAISVTIDEVVDSVRLQQAWLALQKAEPGLVSRVSKHDSQWMQCPASEPLQMVVVDYSMCEKPEEEAVRFFQDESARAFELSALLTKCVLLKLSETRWSWYIKQHHVITDAWSFAAIWRQLKLLYKGTSSSAELKIEPFAQYAAESINFVAGNDAASKLAFEHWEGQLPDQPMVLFDSTSKPPTTEAPRRVLAFDEQRRADLTAMTSLSSARSFNSQLSTGVVLMTVLSALLSRLSGDRRITLGVPVPNRSDVRYADTPGLFVEVLPMSVEVDDAATFDSLATSVRTALMSHLKYAVPGASAVGKTAMINVVFNYINVMLEPWGERAIDVQWWHPGHADEQHALRLQVSDWEGSGTPTLAFDTNVASFSATGIEQLESCWWYLFEAMRNDPTQRILDVPLVRGLETQGLSGTSSSADWPVTASFELLLDRFRERVQQHPRQVAVTRSGPEQEHPDVGLSSSFSVLDYAELDRQSDAVALALAAKGVGVGQRVLVFQSRTPALMVSILGVLKSGAAYVPIDGSTPIARVEWIMSDSQASLVISEPQLPSLSHDIKTEQLDDLIRAGSASHADEPPERPSSDAMAYLLYTSGSTGQPKGVSVSHGALANYLGWAADYYTKGESLCFPLFTSLGFDLTVTSLFVPLISGGSLRMYPESATPGDIALLEVVRENVVDLIKLTPSHLALLQGVDLSQSRVKQLIVGGEDLKQSLAERIHTAFAGRVAIHNEYGPTECTVGCVVHTFKSGESSRSVPIGKPITGVQVHVLNSAQQAQPTGVAGELYLAGASLADGYWQLENETRDAFVANTATPELRLYKTGDLVRIDESGRLVYLGRQDNQVKVGGVRVELAEVEAAALAIPGVSQCLVTMSSRSKSTVAEVFCERCGLSSRYPESDINDAGTCGLCRQFEQYEQRARSYFRPMKELDDMVSALRQKSSGEYDCLMLLSGGKDSSYALSRLVDYGLNILAFTLDNGYISEGAKSNIARVCNTLGVDHQYGQTPHMNAIFADSLSRHSNVCNGCFKVLYTLSLELAETLNIPTIITGLSRGQFFETRLTEELFTASRFDIRIIDETVLSTRKAYHQTDDAVSRCMNVEHVRDPALFDRISIIDFYRYCDVNLDEMYRYLDERVPWIRPADTGRSTNCLINDVGIHVHKIEQGYHNYSLPYSWDVRLGHKQRDEALEELDDQIDIASVDKILDEIGYQIKPLDHSKDDQMVLYYSSDSLTPGELKTQLQQGLPAWMLPAFLVPLPRFPLTENGKVDLDALPVPSGKRESMSGGEYRSACNDLQRWLTELWAELLKMDSIGIDDNFFELGGDSLKAIRIVARINAQGYSCSVTDLFERPTVATLAEVLESNQPSNSIDQEQTEASEAFDALGAAQLAQLTSALADQSVNNR